MRLDSRAKLERERFVVKLGSSFGCGTMGCMTNLKLDDALVREVLEATGKTSKREAVQIALEDFVRYRKQLEILEHFGTVEYEEGWNNKRQRQIP
jgi:Arc/MetJ family transcription regulator